MMFELNNNKKLSEKSSAFLIDNLLSKPTSSSSSNGSYIDTNYNPNFLSIKKRFSNFFENFGNFNNSLTLASPTNSLTATSSSSFEDDMHQSKNNSIHKHPSLWSVSSSNNIQQQSQNKILNFSINSSSFNLNTSNDHEIIMHSSRNKPNRCEMCGKSFSTSSSLKTHSRIHSGEKPFVCGLCGKRFTARSNYCSHRLTHTADKPHKCSKCIKSFSTPGDLRIHMYSHEGTFPFHCEKCNKGFTQIANLKTHMITHTGVKAFNCVYCDKNFSLACNLKQHINTQHYSKM